MSILREINSSKELSAELNLLRIEWLRNVLAWSLEHGRLSAGKRILIHQEIASILNYLEMTESTHLVPKIYRIPDELNETVEHIMGIIIATNWKKTEVKY